MLVEHPSSQSILQLNKNKESHNIQVSINSIYHTERQTNTPATSACPCYHWSMQVRARSLFVIAKKHAAYLLRVWFSRCMCVLLFQIDTLCCMPTDVYLVMGNVLDIMDKVYIYNQSDMTIQFFHCEKLSQWFVLGTCTWFLSYHNINNCYLLKITSMHFYMRV